MRSLLLTHALALSVCPCLLAGPLSPPAGPIAPTPGPEPRIAVNATNTPGDSDSLFKITQPGSYYLTGNITGVAAKHGIEITSSGVTLDLNGFALLGVPGSLDGVSITTPGTNSVAVLNGAVLNWGDMGIDFQSSGSSRNARIENIRANGNSSTGIVPGAAAILTGCSASSNNIGFNIGDECAMQSCTATFNNSNGIIAGIATAISNCAASDNSGAGFSVSSGSSISNCSARRNSTSGINASQSSVTDCAVRENTLDGIICGSACLIRGNLCVSNGFGASVAAGIRATGSDNRIEDNNCLTADIGILCDAPGNFIVRNSCSGNTTNWSFVTNNIFGPIIDRTLPPIIPAVSGNAAASSLGSTDPNANFSY